MVPIKPFVDEARAIVRDTPARSERALSKKAARPLRQRCLAWLAHAPVDSSKAVFGAWGGVVAALVTTEDILRTGTVSIKNHRAPEALMQWLDTMATLSPESLFSTVRGQHVLYANACRCATAVRRAKGYSATLHDALVEHRWNPVPFLVLLARCRDGHRSFRINTRIDTGCWPEEAWTEAMLAVAHCTSWCAPDNPMLHALWTALPMFAQIDTKQTNAEGSVVLCWNGPEEDFQALVSKLAACMPHSTADALHFAQAHPQLVSGQAFKAIAAMDLRAAPPTAGLYAWLRMHTSPRPSKLALRAVLESQFPEMDKVLRSYVQIVPDGQEILHALTMLPAWEQWVLGHAPKVEEEIPGDLFAC